MKCFYHSADLDGHCSGALVKMAYPDCEMIGINYGQKFPFDEIEFREVVFMVDFTLQPFDQMITLNELSQLIWIDHHKTEIEEAEKRDFKAEGIRRIGIGACALVWEFLHEEIGVIEIPSDAIILLAEYDVWNHSRPDTLPFQYGFRMFENTRPDNQELWRRFVFSDMEVDEVVNLGQNILKYEEQQNKKFCQAYSFETKLNGLKAIACNRGFTNSKIFDSVWDEKKFDLMITFIRLKLPAEQWTVSLYSTKQEIDCGAIARQYGGGGHKGAAGFQCKELPFLY